jgi:DNA-directed RNA polymerase beta subunit/intein/homing endonuclease
MMSEEHTWNILGDHFKRKGFVHHQTESFDQFINVGIHKIITEEPEIVLNSKNGKNPGSYTSYKVSFSNVYVPNPTVTEDTRVLRGFFPAEARQRDLTYDSPIYATVTETLEIDGKEPETNQHVRVVLGRIPIMLRSSKCYLTDMTPEERIQAGECKYDQGGYFLIRGKERVLVSQLRGVYNTPLVYEQRSGDKYSFSCEMRSMSEETGHSVLISAVIGVDDRTLSFSLPYIKDYIPMGVVFKAMGYRTEQFADLIGLSCEKTKKYISLIINDSFFVEEKDDGFALFVFENQKKVAESLQVDETTADGKRRVNDKLKEMWKNENAVDWKHKSTKINALKYIGQHTNHPIKESERKDYAEQVVECEIFPHMGVTSTIKEKAYLLGHMIHKLLATRLGIRKPDDRDNYINKRVESPGVLCHELFRQLFKKYIGSIIAIIEKKKQLPDAMSIIPRLTDITKGFIHCFGTGNWGVPKNSYVRQGVAQILSRLSYGATLSNLRRVSIPVGKESKNTAIRQINPSQIMYICPVETPEGAPVGIVLNLSLLTRISDRTPTVLVKEVLELCENMSSIKDFKILNEQTKVFLNGILTGVTEEPNELVEELKEMRRIKMLPWDVSISYDEVDDEVNICSDEGRLLRPVFTVKDDSIMAKETDGTNWDELVEKGLIIYIDNMEANGSVIAFTQKELSKYKSSYCEISAAMMLGVMASIIPFPDHSQCIFKDEPVYMANGTVKKICDVQVGDEVITFHPETQQQSITKVSHTYTNKTDKQLFEITTLSGRKITATFDHRFMTFDGWKRIEEIEVGKTLVGVSTEPKPVSNLVDEYIILTEEQFIERCLNAQIKESFVKKYASEISFPIKSTDTNLYIISRLFGFISTEWCYLGFSDQGDVILNVYFTDEHSVSLFNQDAQRLGFKYKCISDVAKFVDLYESTYHSTIEYSGSFPSLFIALGCNNTIQKGTYKTLPYWIKNASDLVKREFLAGFQGGCVSKITSHTSTLIQKTDSVIEFMNDIVELLRYFKIETSNAKCNDNRKTVSYQICDLSNNLIEYFNIVGYRYNVNKNIEIGIYVEYLKYLDNNLQDNKIKLLEWQNLVKWKSTTLFIPLESKIESLETIISDITTESTNQSFLCGDTFCVHNSPRNCYQSSMGKQAMSMFALSHLIRADTVVHVLNNPHRPLVGTKAAEMMGFNEMPSGVNCIVAIACYTGFNQEDSVMLNHSAVQRGLFWATTYKTHVDEEKKQGYNCEKIGIPPLNIRKHDANYGLLDQNGIVRLRHSKWIDEKGQTKGGGSIFVQKGDVIIGKISIQSDKSGNEVITDCSLIIGKGEEGYIDRIFLSTTPNGYKLIKIVIRSLRIPEVGDKFASRAAQKGTVGMIYRQEDMPFTKDGISPDIIINPHCLAEDHEILTESGFMNWKEAKDGYNKGTLRIASYNHKTGNLVYEFPTAFILNDSKTQEMIKFTDKLSSKNNVSLLVTDDHDMFAKCGKIEENCPIWDDYKKIKAHELLSSNKIDLIKFIGKARSGFKGNITDIPFINLLVLNTREKLFAFCELYGYWLANGGCLGFCGNSLEVTSVKLSDDEWLRKRFTILELVLFTDYTYDTSRSSIINKNWRSRWSITNKDWINTFCSNHNKKSMALWVWNLPADLARYVLSGLRYVDGSEKANRNIIRTECAQFRDEIIRLTLHSGYSSYFEIRNEEINNRVSWIIFYTNNNIVSEPVLNTHTDVKKIEYVGLTWCVTMPSGFIITRRATRNKENIVVKASRPIITGQCIPSRMTINQLIESVMGKSCVINGKYGDATPFTDESKNIAEEACKTLGMNGYESTGKEILMNGMTGEPMGMFFIGPVYYQRLKHLVSDKMHARATGPITTLTRQPLEGRSRDGGQRFGEMERDCFCSVPIPLNCGLSVKIETMENKDYSVLSYHEEKKEVIPSKQSNFLYKGERECVDVVFQDGRIIRGTDNHKILTSENIWIPIHETKTGITQIKTGITNPLIDVKEEIEKCANWKFQAGNTKLEVTDEESYFRTLSFARLVGYISADGGIYYITRTKTYTGVINLGHKIDVTSVLEDLEKFSIIKQQVFTSKKYYSIRIPQNFVEDLMAVKGMIIGTKINQPAQLPNFITDPSCPLPIVREFLGGLFGADGHTCVLALHRGKRDLLTSVSFSKSRIGSQQDSLQKMMEQLQILLARFDIHNVTIQKAKETTSSKKKVNSLQENKSYQLTLHLCIDELPRFHEKIGFRYCCHKSQRLEAGASYKRLRDGVTRQHNWLVQRVDELTNFSEIKNQFPEQNVPTKKAILQAVKDLNKTETLLHEYAIPSAHDINDHLVKGTSFGKFRGKGFPNAEEYLKDIGALDWFLQDEPVKPEIDSSLCEDTEDITSVSYGVNCECEGLPTMNLRVIDIRPAGVHPVYDIQVDNTHTFLANGIVAHNCMIGHGVSKFLQERLFLVSDKYQVSICNKCGNFATSKTECQSCETDQISLVKLPYVGKLVIQELNAMMIKTKITAK